MVSEHPTRADINARVTSIVFFVTDFDVYKAVMSFPNGSVPQFLKTFFSKSKGNAGLNVLKCFTWLLNLIGEGKKTRRAKIFFLKQNVSPS